MTAAFDPDLWPSGWDEQPGVGISPAPGKPTGRLPNLPPSFWEERPYLATIRDAAHYYGRSADAVFANVFARTSAMIHPKIKFDFGLTPGILNMFCAVVGPSGAGKSAARQVAQEIAPNLPHYLQQDGMFRDGIGLGTGEGMVEAYMGIIERETGEIHRSGPKKGDPKTEKVRDLVRRNVFFFLDEGEALTKMIERSGTTIGPALRSAWAGTPLGQANAREETTRLLPGGEYAMGMVIGYQPDTAQPLLADVGPGTPQRFLWFSATDPNIPDTPPARPERLNLLLDPDDMQQGSIGAGTITCHEDIRTELWQRNLTRARGDAIDDPMDSHISLMLCKVAGLLAVFDGRMKVTLDDWRLARVIWDTSCSVRDRLIQQGKDIANEKFEKQTEAHVERELRAHLAKSSADTDVDRLARLIARHIQEDGPTTRGMERKRIAKRDRPLFDAAIAYAIGRGWLTFVDDNVLTTGDAVPA